MIKTLLVAILSLLLLQNAHAQKKDTAVYCMMNSGRLAASRTSADYYLFILPADTTSGETLYPIQEYYYPSGHPKFSGYSSINRYNSLTFEGACISYFPNGHKQSIMNYANGALTGDATLYYPNGSLNAIEKYINKKCMLITCRDSAGNILAEKGNGKWVKCNYDGDFEIEEGTVKDSLEEGEWHEMLNNSIKYITVYTKGVILSTTDPNRVTGDVFDAVEVEPKCDGFNNYLARAVRYPAYDKEHNIQGKVVVQFIVEKNGSLSNIRIIKGPSKGLDDEVLRVMSLSPPWQPGMQKGKPVRVKFTVPVSFSLSIDDQ